MLHADLPYVTNGHPRQILDLYLPEKPSASRPLVVVVHGGGWRNGDKAGQCASGGRRAGPAARRICRGQRELPLQFAGHISGADS